MCSFCLVIWSKYLSVIRFFWGCEVCYRISLVKAFGQYKLFIKRSFIKHPHSFWPCSPAKGCCSGSARGKRVRALSIKGKTRARFWHLERFQADASACSSFIVKPVFYWENAFKCWKHGHVWNSPREIFTFMRLANAFIHHNTIQLSLFVGTEPRTFHGDNAMRVCKCNTLDVAVHYIH